jgi:ABC-type bacteriocin/lantibiotic exporter with double-glycine peptidase domain
LLIGYAAMMLAYDLRVGGAIMLMAGLRAALVARTQSAVTRATAAELAAQGREAQVVVEGLSAPELVLAFDAEELLRDRYEERCVARLNAEISRRVASERTVQLTSAADGFAHAAVVYLGGLEVLDDQLTLGVFAGLVSLQALFHKPVASLVETFSMFSRAGAVLARMDDVLDEPAAAPGTHMLSAVRGSLELVDVSFSYEGRPTPVCEAVNLRIQAGERVAVVGRSGQGKSTLLRLLSGMLRPSSGRVLLDGIDLATIAPASLAEHVGVVLQEPFLLNDSVRANLAFGVPEAAETQIRSAARLACIDERICALPESYDTVLGENGARLSGGEKQRLALARALLRRPRVLLLDEATSSLDLPTEARLHRNLSELGCTRVLIAHRLETVRDADRILVFEAGRIVQQGSYEALRRIPGLFSSLVSSAQRGAA